MVKIYEYIGENADNFAFFNDAMVIAILAIMKSIWLSCFMCKKKNHLSFVQEEITVVNHVWHPNYTKYDI